MPSEAPPSLPGSRNAHWLPKYGGNYVTGVSEHIHFFVTLFPERYDRYDLEGKKTSQISEKKRFFLWDCSYSFAASERRAPALRVENGGQADDRAGAEGVGRQAGLRDGGQVGVGGQTGRRHRSEHAAAAHAHPDAAQRGADHAARPATGRRRRCHQQRTRQSCRESISTELYFFFFCLLFVLSVSQNQETLGIFTKPDFDDYNSSRVIEIEPFSFKNK